MSLVHKTIIFQLKQTFAIYFSQSASKDFKNRDSYREKAMGTLSKPTGERLSLRQLPGGSGGLSQIGLEIREIGWIHQSVLVEIRIAKVAVTIIMIRSRCPKVPGSIDQCRFQVGNAGIRKGTQ